MRLPDINVWLALAFEAHAGHILAADWFDTLDLEGCAFCRLTQQGFLRLSTNPSVFGDEAVSMATAWNLYDVLNRDERVFFIHEPEALETAWREFTRNRQRSNKVWNDAYLAAFAMEAGLELVTFDRGFREYPDLQPVILA